MADPYLVTFIASLSQRQWISWLHIHEFLLDWLCFLYPLQYSFLGGVNGYLKLVNASY